MDLHRNWSLKGCPLPIGARQSPLLHHCNIPDTPWSPASDQASNATRGFSPNVRRLETTGCPSNRLWACVCCAGGVSCERCSVWVRGKVFVSPSPGPSVCCASVGCGRCCGSSTGRKPDPGPARRGPHLETHDKVKHGGGHKFEIFHFLCFHSTTFWTRILFFLLYYIYFRT